MAGRLGKRNAILIEVVGDRDLSAERIAALANADLVNLVIGGLQQDRQVQFRAVDQFGNRNLIAKVGQTDHHPVNLITVLAEESRIDFRVRNTLHRAIRRRFKRQDQRFDA